MLKKTKLSSKRRLSRSKSWRCEDNLYQHTRTHTHSVGSDSRRSLPVCVHCFVLNGQKQASQRTGGEVRQAVGDNLMRPRQHQMGVRMGYRVLLLVSHRERSSKRELRILPMLTFISQTCWRYLFGRTGDLFKSSESETECECLHK